MAAQVKSSAPADGRDEWFDRLARGAAGRMSRRGAVGLVAGTSVMAILGSWMRPRAALGARANTMSDAACPGTRTFYREGCDKKVPKLNHTPAVNGCGPQNGVNVIPQSPLYLATFTPACDEHDRGYGTCNRTKEATDTKFLADMKLICVRTYPAAGFFDDLFLVQCIKTAETYYTAVDEFAVEAYKDGQKEGCDCCDECPGGEPKCGDWPLPGRPADSPDTRQCCPKGFICHGTAESYGFKPGISKCWKMCMRPKDVQYIPVKECRDA